jgi:hypothetical protein
MLGSMFAILRALGMFVADLFKSRRPTHGYEATREAAKRRSQRAGGASKYAGALYRCH